MDTFDSLIEHSAFSISKEARTKLSIANHMIRTYLSSREGLKELGILRSDRTLQFPVFFSYSLELLAILRLPYDVVFELGSQTSKRFSFRCNKTTKNDNRVERLL